MIIMLKIICIPGSLNNVIYFFNTKYKFSFLSKLLAWIYFLTISWYKKCDKCSPQYTIFIYSIVKFREKNPLRTEWVYIGPCFIINSRDICHPYRRVPRQIRNDNFYPWWKVIRKGALMILIRLFASPLMWCRPLGKETEYRGGGGQTT